MISSRGGGGGEGSIFNCSPKKHSLVQRFFFKSSLLHKISETLSTQLSFPCFQLYFPFVPLFLVNYGHVPLWPESPARDSCITNSLPVTPCFIAGLLYFKTCHSYWIKKKTKGLLACTKQHMAQDTDILCQ